MKPGKAPGLDGLTLDLWKLPRVRTFLRGFCIQTFEGHRPDEWGIPRNSSSAQERKPHNLRYQLNRNCSEGVQLNDS